MASMGLSWEDLFGVIIPELLSALLPDLRKQLDIFHARMASRPVLSRHRYASLRFLKKHILEHQETFRHAIDSALAEIQAIQREASRSFYPRMQNAMDKTYAQCANFSGKKSLFPNNSTNDVNSTIGRGSYRISQEAMLAELSFAKSAKKYKDVSKSAIKSVEDIYTKIQNDLLEDSLAATGSVICMLRYYVRDH